MLLFWLFVFPYTACTPEGCRPKLPSIAPNPLTREKVVGFAYIFNNECSDRWRNVCCSAWRVYQQICRRYADQAKVETLSIADGDAHYVGVFEVWSGQIAAWPSRPFSPFEVMSDHLAVDVIMVSTSLLKGNLQLAAGIRVENEKASRVLRVEGGDEG